jgi:hypothetical protein
MCQLLNRLEHYGKHNNDPVQQRKQERQAEIEFMLMGDYDFGELFLDYSKPRHEAVEDILEHCLNTYQTLYKVEGKGEDDEEKSFE